MSTDSQKIPIRPHGTAVLILQSDPEKTTASGIVIPGTAQEKENKGVVLAVGRGGYTSMGILIPCECKVGETVYWNKYQGTEVKFDGQSYWLVKEDVIDGHLTEEA